MSIITVLSPEGESHTTTKAMPGLPADLRGLTIGFLDNTKSNFELLTSEMGDILKRLGVKGVIHRKKANASTAASRDIIEALSKECDVVFAGSAD
jgi:hypothetical protein